MFNNLQIVPKLNSENDYYVQRVVQSIKAAGKRAKLDFNPDAAAEKTLVVAVGGDGTMLEAMRRSARYGSVALGVNLGRVGFLSDISVTDKTLVPLIETMEAILQNRMSVFVEERTVLKAQTCVQDMQLAGNEITVSQRYSDSMICYQLKIGNMNAGMHRANSIMVATATGSTAYSLSAGGALMMPDLQSMQIVPVAPLTLTSRPIVVPSRLQVQIDAWGGPVSVRVDGQPYAGVNTERVYTKEDPFRIWIEAYQHPAKILHIEGWNYFDVLTTKLGWIKE